MTGCRRLSSCAMARPQTAANSSAIRSARVWVLSRTRSDASPVGAVADLQSFVVRGTTGGAARRPQSQWVVSSVGGGRPESIRLDGMHQ